MISSLRDSCIRVLAIHFDSIGAVGPLDSHLYALILCHDESRASENAVAKIERLHPNLVSSASDEYWRQRKECVAASASRGLAPMPSLIARVKNLLLRRPLPVADLDKIPMSIRLLAETQVGKALRRYAKDHPQDRKASELLARWKHLASSGTEDYVLSRIDKVKSWKQLYFLLAEAEVDRVKKIGMKVRKMADDAANAKRLTRRIDKDPPKRRQSHQSATFLPPTTFVNVSKPKIAKKLNEDDIRASKRRIAVRKLMSPSPRRSVSPNTNGPEYLGEREDALTNEQIDLLL